MTLISKVNADFYPDRINMYVPGMQYAAEVRNDGLYQVSLGTPALAVADFFLNGQSTAAAGNQDFTWVSDAAFGRAITIDCSGANTDLVTITGFDYLGQAMTEELALNGTTVVPGLKAFKRITNIAWLLQASEDIDVGFGNPLGLPYKTVKVELETSADIVASLGTLIVGVVTDPAIATTADPRGLYPPGTTLDGIVEVMLTAHASDAVNSSGNGGLHGISHYSA